MTSRITHLVALPKNIDYWDYYILCRCNDHAAGILQRMEYWDGTKADGNIHSEQINDHLAELNQPATQDTSRFVYKTSDELAWEMIGTCNEKTARYTLSFLTDTLKYLAQRRNPYNTFDRTKQYAFQEKLVQTHLDQLCLIVKHFHDMGRQQRPVLYAIEQLTIEGVYVYRTKRDDGTLDGKDTLSIELVTEYLKKMHKQMSIDEQEGQKKRESKKSKYVPLLPTFIKFDLKKDEAKGFSDTISLPSGNFTGSNNTILPDGNGKKDRMETDVETDGSGKITGAIPITTTLTTNSNNITEMGTHVAPAFADRNDTHVFSSESSQLSTPTEEISSESVDKSGQNVNDMSEPPQASEQSYSQQTTQNTPVEKPARAPRQRKPSEPKVPTNVIELTPEQEERATGWGERINKWRGYELEKRGAIINERQCIRRLVKKYSDQDIKRVYAHLFKNHWKWSKPDNRYKIGANEVWQEAPAILQELSGTVPAELSGAQNERKIVTDTKALMDTFSSTSNFKPLALQPRTPERKAQ